MPEASDESSVAPEPVVTRRRWALWLGLGLALVVVLIAVGAWEIIGVMADDGQVDDGEEAFAAGDCEAVRELAEDLEGYRPPFDLGGAASDLADEIAECEAYEEALAAETVAYRAADCDEVSTLLEEASGDRWPFTHDEDLALIESHEAECRLWLEASDGAEADPGGSVLVLMTFAEEEPESPLAAPALETIEQVIAGAPPETVADEELCRHLDMFEQFVVAELAGASEVWLECARQAAAAGDDAGVIRAIDHLESLISLTSASDELSGAAMDMVGSLEPAHQGLALATTLDESLRPLVLAAAVVEPDFCEWLVDSGGAHRADTEVLSGCAWTMAADGGSTYVDIVLLLAAEVPRSDLAATLDPVLGTEGVCSTPGRLDDLSLGDDLEKRHLQGCLTLDLTPTVRLDYLLTLAEVHGDFGAIAELSAGRPAHGTEIESGLRGGSGTLKIRNDFDHDVLFVIDRGDTRLALYVHAKEVADFYGIQDGDYEIRYAQGRYWEPELQTFRIPLGARRMDDHMVFTTTTSGNTTTYTAWEFGLVQEVDEDLDLGSGRFIDPDDVLGAPI